MIGVGNSVIASLTRLKTIIATSWLAVGLSKREPISTEGFKGRRESNLTLRAFDAYGL